MKDYISILRDKFKFSNLELICLAIIVIVGSVILFRYDEESIGGRLFRFDRLTQTVEARIYMGDNEYRWEPRPHFKNLQHVRDYIVKQDRNNQIRAIEEQTEAMERMQRQQQMKGEINGDLTYGSLEEAVEDEEAAMDMLSSGEIYFQMMDLAILGSITDLQKMIDEVEDLEDSNLSETDEEEYYAKSEEIINKYVKLWACFVDDKRKFADVEFYFEEFTETYFWLI